MLMRKLAAIYGRHVAAQGLHAVGKYSHGNVRLHEYLGRIYCDAAAWGITLSVALLIFVVWSMK